MSYSVSISGHLTGPSADERQAAETALLEALVTAVQQHGQQEGGAEPTFVFYGSEIQAHNLAAAKEALAGQPVGDEPAPSEPGGPEDPGAPA